MLKASWPFKAGLAPMVVALALVAGCVPNSQQGGRVQNRPAANQPARSNALSVGVRSGPELSSMGLTDPMARGAILAFRESCPKLLARNDVSGLTRNSDWREACDAVTRWPVTEAASFFTTQFETAIVGTGELNATGYYEPEIAGSRNWSPDYAVPVYRQPPDLVHARPGDAPVKSNGQTPFGRYDEFGRFVPYYSRAEIENGVLDGRGLEIAWVADPVEFFFLQIQGSGRLRLPDGTVMRIGYAAENGHPYTGIGTIMSKRGLVGTGPGQYPASMQGLMRYIRDYPEEGRALMRENKSWIFFRELLGGGPIGAMGVPVHGQVSVAADPLFVPLGAPVFLAPDPALAGALQTRGLWVAQDTGGAIKGPNRFDTFWGAGEQARVVAGGMKARGQAILLLPRGTLSRLGAK